MIEIGTGTVKRKISTRATESGCCAWKAVIPEGYLLELLLTLQIPSVFMARGVSSMTIELCTRAAIFRIESGCGSIQYFVIALDVPNNLV